MDFKTPGVYVQEIATLPASVAPVATAVPAFIGYTETATDADGGTLINVPTRISSLLDYVTLFGGAPSEDGLTVTFTDVLDGTALVSRAVNVSFTGTRKSFRLYHSIQMYFANGGGPCWIVSTGTYGDTPSPDVETELKDGIDSLEKIDEPTILVVPDAVALFPAGDVNYAGIIDQCLNQCNKLQDRFTIIDVHDNGDPSNGSGSDSNEFRDLSISGELKYGAAYYPDMITALNYNYAETAVAIDHSYNVAPPVDYGAATLSTLQGLDSNAYNQALAALANFRVVLSPSGIMAGIYARVDRDRGVWKAPANVVVSNVVGPNTIVTAADQEDLNVDVTAGKSINAIRAFTGKGTLVWGARTLAGNDNEWRYVPVRRLFIFLEESIEKASEALVFEANDANTWLRIKTMIEAFLNGQWSAGALAGSTPEQAYFVNVGLGSTMTAQDILEGRMIVEIGVAAVRPAEFIILRFSHKLQES